ncbi:MAG: hypothetical protein ACRBCI_13395 [Cellvibrionaceae bacterium]
MDDNIYKAPEANLVSSNDEANAQFYIVSIKKFTILFFATVGMYPIYWFYKNWKLQKERHDLSIWPVARGIFSIFYAHTLFNKIDSVLQQKQKVFEWSAGAVATSYVVLTVVSTLMSQLASKEIGSPYTDILSIAALPVLYVILLKAQKAINLSQNDPEGEANNQLTGANIVWIFIGLLLWALIILGLLIVLNMVVM